MGVQSLSKLLKAYAPNSMSVIDLDNLQSKKVAIDTSLLLYKFILAYRNSNKGEDLITKDGRFVSHIYGIKNKLFQLLKKNITPIFIFDGKPPDLKKKTLIGRKMIKTKATEKLNCEEDLSEEEKIKLKKRTYCITDDHIRETQEFLSLMGISYIQSIEEAESQCAVLNMDNKVDGVLTEDWDVLLFGGRKMYKTSPIKGKVIEVDLDKILKSLDLTHEQFVELCIVLGTDYCPGIKGIGPIKAYEEYKKAGSLSALIDHIEKGNNILYKHNKLIKYSIPDEFYEKWEIVKDYYMNAVVIDPKTINVEWKYPNINALKEFLINKYDFNKEATNRDITNIINIYNINKTRIKGGRLLKTAIRKNCGYYKQF